jgi:hypothetical protein
MVDPHRADLAAGAHREREFPLADGDGRHLHRLGRRVPVGGVTAPGENQQEKRRAGDAAFAVLLSQTLRLDFLRHSLHLECASRGGAGPLRAWRPHRITVGTASISCSRCGGRSSATISPFFRPEAMPARTKLAQADFHRPLFQTGRLS